MRAIKIDVRRKEVYEIDIEPGLDAMYTALECDMVEAVTIARDFYSRSFGGRETLWVDEEGLLHDPIGAFELNGRAFSGHGLILRTTEEGESTGTKIALENIQQYTRFIDPGDLPDPEIQVYTL